METTTNDPDNGPLNEPLAEATGESPAASPDLLKSVARIQAAVAALPDLDRRTPEEILGYAGFGLPT